jgi:gluconolactonase
MNRMHWQTFAAGLFLAATLALVAGAARAAAAAGEAVVPTGAPEASLDLNTAAGLEAAGATWRWADARVVDVDFKSVGADLKPSGAPNRTQDVVPHAEAKDFDDRAWTTIGPGGLPARRGNGKVSFGWYRLALTLPQRAAGVSIDGATLVLETLVDDYAEIWVDGVLARELGQSGGTVVAGFNAPNRVVLTRDAQPGRTIHVAIFAANGPISLSPENYIWMRYAKLDVYAAMRGTNAPEAVATSIVRLDPAFDTIVPPGTKLERVATGFQFTEGPIWANGRLWFSDPNANRIYERTGDGSVRVLREKSGYEGADVARYHQPGSNGLTLDGRGRLTIAEHGRRRVSRLEPDGRVTVLADRYEGKRLNSPNDLVYRSDGALFFTDPPFGLPAVYADPAKELPYSGVYALVGGTLRLLTQELLGPNGIAFSPDERFLYVGNWDEKRKVVMRYDVAADGSLSNGKVFADLGDVAGEEAIDGVKVDRIGNVYVSGPGGLWVYAPSGTRLGGLRGPELAANFAWGESDAKTLYLTARTGVYRVRLGVPGVRPEPAIATATTAATADGGSIGGGR